MPEAKKVPKAPVVVKTPVADKPKKKKAAVVPVSLTATYVEGAYNPKAELNIASFNEVKAVLPGTYGAIQKAIPKHADFVGYLIRRGGLVQK